MKLILNKFIKFTINSRNFVKLICGRDHHDIQKRIKAR